jgi:catechol 2,3-dioxygenase-like lactoylglutathione lyase family enzyme
MAALGWTIAAWMAAAGAAAAQTSSQPPIQTPAVQVSLFLTVRDIDASVKFYAGVLGGAVVRAGAPSVVLLANTRIVLNTGGGPTDDKPDITLSAPEDPHRASSFLNLRVADIQARYAEWKGRGAVFLTPPIRKAGEIRCYMRDPDGYIIEVGQSL